MKMTSKKQLFILTLGLALTVLSVRSQAQKTDPKLEHKAHSAMRQGNRAYNDATYADAEYQYRTSASLADTNTDNAYNLGNAMLQQKRYKEAVRQFRSVTETAKDDNLKAKAYYNSGNAFMGLKDYQNAVNYYKESLKLNPDDEEARYNYALAKKFLKENPPQDNQNQDDKQENKDQQDNKDEQDKDQNKDENDEGKQDQNEDQQENKDQQNKGQNEDDKQDKDQQNDQQDQNNGDDQNDQQDQDNPSDQNNGQNDPQNQNDQQPRGDNPNEQPQNAKGKMSRQQIEQLLEALNNEEKKTQAKVNAVKTKGVKRAKAKDW